MFFSLANNLNSFNLSRICAACSKSRAFAAFNKIQSILEFMAENKIDPDSEQGKHCLLDLGVATNEYNQVFIEHGLDPQLRFNCKKITIKDIRN